jgi:hypothetical protein
MNLNFDHKHYVPVLRWKRAERVALRALTPQTSSQVTPLLELVPTVDNAPSKVSEEVLRSWGFSPFFLDLGNLPEMERADTLVSLSDGMRVSGLRPILVTGLDRESKYQTAVEQVTTTDRRGACIRLYPRNLVNSSLAADLSGLLTRLALRPDEVDLLVDYQLISDFAMPYTMLCSRIPYLSQWRTFTVMSGAFSQDLTEYQKNGQYIRYRDDWLFWQAQVASSLPRRPAYGDYSIQYALYIEPPEQANVSASIRYTTNDYWVIMRGEGLFNEGSPGNAQYAAHAKLLCEREEFCGRAFSYGDRYIDRLNLGIEGPGNPETLLRAGVNHHVTFVADQLSKSSATSIADAPFLAQSPNRQPGRVENRLSREAYNARARLPQARPRE